MFPGGPSPTAPEGNEAVALPGFGRFEPDDPRRRGRRGFGRPTTPGLRPWVEARREYLLSVDEVARPAPAADVSRVSTTVTGRATTITVTPTGGVAVADARLYHSTGRAEPFTRVPMRAEGGVWRGDIPGLPGESSGRYYVELRGANGATAFFPARAEAGAWRYEAKIATSSDPAIVINEFMAKNETTHADPQGDFDDWIELANTTDSTIDLTGHFLSDDPTEPTKWSFPKGAAVGPRGYLMVWADGGDGSDGTAEGMHAAFRLSADGESVLLVGPSADGVRVLDRVDYGEQAADVSLGRSPNLVGGFAAMSPSPGRANDAP